MTTTVRQMLARKPDVYALGPEATIFEALQMMADRNVGAILVLEGDDIAGIVSERDYARKVVLLGKTSKDTPVREIMTTNVICVEPGRTANECMALMTEKRVRHLPVVERGRVLGVISIGDVVRAVVDEHQFTIRSLEQYIASGG